MAFLDVLFTMDCEATAEFSSEGGPPSWESAEKAITGYCELLLEKGLTPTLFVVPRAAERLGPVLLKLERLGAELALHFHPQDHGYADYLGAYTYDEQMQMLAIAGDAWSAALGRWPKSFRGGNASANDATFPALAELGFKQGSLSIPGRNFTRVRSNWPDSPMRPYRTNRANRLIPGDMDFLEIPITVDWESVMWGGLTKLELRVEMVDARAHGFTIRKSIDRQLGEGFENPYLVILTHNIFDYSDLNEFRRNVLLGIIGEIENHARQRELIIRGHTVSGYNNTVFKEAQQ